MPSPVPRSTARQFAPDEIGTVYLASGANFADAVAAAPSGRTVGTLSLLVPAADAAALLAGDIGE